ncbi:MAG: hypothetical protein ACUZ8I_03690 [Candidatus Scalindua sp.]
MIRHQLLLISLRFSIYSAVFIFFLSCVLGYASGLAIETLIQKAVIAGSLFGLTSFVMLKMLVRFVPVNIGVEDSQGINNENKDAAK